MDITVRLERAADAAAIETIIVSAFASAAYSSHTEQHIVRDLRAAGALSISLLAEAGGALVAHAGVSPVSITDGSPGWFGLAPVSVIPAHQRQGIGSRLIRESLRMLRESGAKGCVVLGEPDYYGRFGFRADPNLVLTGVPAEFFQAMSFGKSNARGAVAYHRAFGLTRE
jgi:putative acetyltransferase